MQSVPAYNRSGQQYQTNNSPPINNSGAGVTQISTAELQVRFFSFFYLLVNQNGDGIFDKM